MTKSTQPFRSSAKPRLIPLLLLLGAAALLIAAAVIVIINQQPAAAPQASGSPNLQVDRALVDAGDVPLGQMVEVTFQLANTGGLPLTFTEPPYIEVKEGC